MACLAIGQWREAADVLADAFLDDPVFGWLLPDGRTRMHALRRFFALEARRIALPHGHSVGAVTADGAGGVALVLPPDRWRTPFRVQAVYGPRYAQIFRTRLPRALGVLTQLERRHPRDEHVYFPYIGVARSGQGKGVGTALLVPVLRQCDRDGLPAYLEASNPRCARLYRRLGFETCEVVTPLGAPPVELMRRPPVRGQTGAESA